MGFQKTVWLQANIGDKVIFRHPKRYGRVEGVVEDITVRLKDKDYTYHIKVTTFAGRPATLNAKKDSIIGVL
ncbi:hypothetical protein I2I11_04065 [Pontibacter sp. 172403-2]|uniref:hypothetical protein n=1 Tax=Pontibacter rufus TaxID=2791028 RepID=UPI0018B015B4|nr:hypothetical protein [Pontibacter sp. 172403-2]MBF9252459.1 hypothetical protein [Pontibacter sp. 172403-2]